MELNNLKPAKGSTKNRKRIGRGNATGQGRTAGKGHKGYKSRSGTKNRFHFEASICRVCVAYKIHSSLFSFIC